MKKLLFCMLLASILLSGCLASDLKRADPTTAPNRLVDENNQLPNMEKPPVALPQNPDANNLVPKKASAQDIVEDLENAQKEIDNISKELQK